MTKGAGEHAEHNRQFRKQMYDDIKKQDIKIALLEEWKKSQTRHSLTAGLTGAGGLVGAIEIFKMFFT